MLELVFWACIVGLFYIYAGYPALIWLLARLRPSLPSKHPSEEPLSVVIVAYNEAGNLATKVRGFLASDCAHRIREIIIASDGSTDDTDMVIRSCKEPRVRVVSFADRRGKPSVLNDVIPQCTSEIVVLADARQELGETTLSELVSNFADERVGVASGELVFRTLADSTTAARGIGVYWKYEKFIRKNESRFGSVPGATGALYAIRKHLFRPLDAQTILDDVAIPMQAVIRGYRCILEPHAIAYDTPSDSPGKEAVRKRRTIAGAAQLIVHHPGWLLPWRNPIWLQYVSHKIGRLFSPVLLLAAAAANVALAAHPVYAILLSAHGCFYLAAFTGWVYQRVGSRSACFGVPLMFVAMNATGAAGLWDAVRGRYRATWKRAV